MLDAPLQASPIKSARAAAAAGGNRLLRPEQPATSRELDEADRAWAARIKSALMANRFRLVQQPIASLVGDSAAMVDLVVRMLDDKGEEVLPSEFLAAAQRTDLLKNIDRWVVGAAMSFCAARKPHRVFVRLSRDSMRDQTLGTWLQQQVRASGVDPRNRSCSSCSEDLATTLPEGDQGAAGDCCGHARLRAGDRELRRRPRPVGTCSATCRSTT